MKLPKQIGFFAMIEKDGPDKKREKGKNGLKTQKMHCFLRGPSKKL